MLTHFKKRMIMNKKVIWICSIILILLVVVGAGIGIWYNKKINSNVAKSIVQISVNPNVQFILNDSNRVIEVNYLNQDGEIVLINANVKGKKLDEVVDIFINASIEVGYIDVDTLGTKIEIYVQNENSEEVEKLQNRIIKNINNIFDKNGIIAGAVARVKDDLITKAQEFGVSVEKYSLMLQASILDTSLDILDLKEKTEQQILEIIKNSVAEYQNIAFSLKNSFVESIQTLKNQFVDMFELDEEIEYLKESINKTNLTEEAKETIKAQIDRCYEKYNELKVKFDEEYNKLVKKFEEDSHSYILKSKEKFKELKENNSAKIKQHLNNFNSNSEEVKQKIKNYRNSLNVV